jgi:hypothetical protein
MHSMGWHRAMAVHFPAMNEIVEVGENAHKTEIVCSLSVSTNS